MAKKDLMLGKAKIFVQKTLLDKEMAQHVAKYQTILAELIKQEQGLNSQILVKNTTAYAPPFGQGVGGICPICNKGAAPGLCKCEELPIFSGVLEKNTFEEDVKVTEEVRDLKNVWAVNWSKGLQKSEPLSKPPVSEAQRKAMHAAASGKSTIGIPKSVGKDFSEADKGGKLPERKHKVSKADPDPVESIAEVESELVAEGKDPSKVPHGVRMQAAQAKWAAKKKGQPTAENKGRRSGDEKTALSKGDFGMGDNGRVIQNPSGGGVSAPQPKKSAKDIRGKLMRSEDSNSESVSVSKDGKSVSVSTSKSGNEQEVRIKAKLPVKKIEADYAPKNVYGSTNGVKKAERVAKQMGGLNQKMPTAASRTGMMKGEDYDDNDHHTVMSRSRGAVPKQKAVSPKPVPNAVPEKKVSSDHDKASGHTMTKKIAKIKRTNLEKDEKTPIDWKENKIYEGSHTHHTDRGHYTRNKDTGTALGDRGLGPGRSEVKFTKKGARGGLTIGYADNDAHADEIVRQHKNKLGNKLGKDEIAFGLNEMHKTPLHPAIKKAMSQFGPKDKELLKQRASEGAKKVKENKGLIPPGKKGKIAKIGNMQGGGGY